MAASNLNYEARAAMDALDKLEEAIADRRKLQRNCGLLAATFGLIVVGLLAWVLR